MNKIFHIILFLLFAAGAQAQQESEAYPGMIFPVSLSFDYDLPRFVEDYDTIDSIRSWHRGVEERARLILVDGYVHLCVHDFYYWSVSQRLFAESFDSYSLTAVSLDEQGNYELLVRAIRKAHNEICYNEYILVNFDKKLAWPLKEYCSRGYFPTGAIVPDIRVWPGKVRFEYVNGIGCSNEQLSVVEYQLGEDTLYKQRLLPGFENLSEPFTTIAVLKGKVGNEPVTMHLGKELGYYHGYYYYNKDKKHIRISDNAYFDKTAPVVFKRYDSDTTWRGTVTDSSFIGIWSDSKSADSFHLRAVYNDENIPLRKYSFKDTVAWHNNARFGLSTSYFLADTTMMSEDDAVAFNTALFGEFGKLYYYEPHMVFRNFREGALEHVNDEIFRDADGMEMYTTIDWTVRYNKNGLFCAQVYYEEYMGGARPGHSARTIMYDADKRETIDHHDILNCPDSVLCDIAKEVYKEYMKGQRQEIDTPKLETECPGAVILTSGGFTVFVHELPLDEYLAIPFARLEKHIRPEYRKRLLETDD